MCWTKQNVFSTWCRHTDRRQPHIFPESVVETLYVELPNDNDNGETFTGFIIEPISLRVRLLEHFETSGITEPFLAACERQTIRLHMALCEWSYLLASKEASPKSCLTFKPIHSVPAVKQASTSCPIYALTVEYHGAQIAK